MSFKELLLVDKQPLSSCAPDSIVRLRQCEHDSPQCGVKRANKYFEQLCWPTPSVVEERITNMQPTSDSPLFSVFSSPHPLQRLPRKTERTSFILERGPRDLSFDAKQTYGKGPIVSSCCSRPFLVGHEEAELCDDVCCYRRDASLSPVMPNAEDDGDDDCDEGLRLFLTAAAKRFVSERVWEKHIFSCEPVAQFNRGVEMVQFSCQNGVNKDGGEKNKYDNNTWQEKCVSMKSDNTTKVVERVDDNDEGNLIVGVKEPTAQSAVSSSSTLCGKNTALKFTNNDFGIVRMMALLLMEEKERNRRYRRGWAK